MTPYSPLGTDDRGPYGHPIAPPVNYRVYLESLASWQDETPAPLSWLDVKNLDNLNRWKIKWAMR